jgi:hypothetical protein
VALMASPVLYAHGGASLEVPENTLEAFGLAVELGADARPRHSGASASGRSFPPRAGARGRPRLSRPTPRLNPRCLLKARLPHERPRLVEDRQLARVEQPDRKAIQPCVLAFLEVPLLGPVRSRKNEAVAIAVTTREIQMDTGTPRSVAARELVGELVREPDRGKLDAPGANRDFVGKKKAPRVYRGFKGVAFALGNSSLVGTPGFEPSTGVGSDR